MTKTECQHDWEFVKKSKTRGNVWSWEDILADLLGILASFVAFLLVVLVVWIVKR